MGCAIRGRIGRPRGRPGRPRGGFTLIELLVVVAIIALLVGILTPALGHARELARRSICGSNLRGVCTALATYATEYGQYPFVENEGDWHVEIGSNRDVRPGAAAGGGRAPTSCLYLLVRGGMAPAGLFVCPSSNESADSATSGDFWDFEDGTAVSYSLMHPGGDGRQFRGDFRGPILGDASPYFDPATGLRNETTLVDLSADDVDPEAGNSPNHAGSGQNLSLVGGSTTWHTRADAGLSGDNIYTRADGDEGADPAGAVPLGPNDPSQGPNGEQDSYLVP
jgi:prepilin-type N-terminal cleavage/methylation domain-containing protein